MHLCFNNGVHLGIVQCVGHIVALHGLLYGILGTKVNNIVVTRRSFLGHHAVKGVEL